MGMIKALLGLLMLTLPFTAMAKTYILTSDPLDPQTAYAIVVEDGLQVASCGSVATPCTAPNPNGPGVVLWYNFTASRDLAVSSGAAQIIFTAMVCNQIDNCSAASTPLNIIAPAPGATAIRIVVLP